MPLSFIVIVFSTNTLRHLFPAQSQMVPFPHHLPNRIKDCQRPVSSNRDALRQKPFASLWDEIPRRCLDSCPGPAGKIDLEKDETLSLARQRHCGPTPPANAALSKHPFHCPHRALEGANSLLRNHWPNDTVENSFEKLKGGNGPVRSGQPAGRLLRGCDEPFQTLFGWGRKPLSRTSPKRNR